MKGERYEPDDMSKPNRASENSKGVGDGREKDGSCTGNFSKGLTVEELEKEVVKAEEQIKKCYNNLEKFRAQRMLGGKDIKEKIQLEEDVKHAFAVRLKNLIAEMHVLKEGKVEQQQEKLEREKKAEQLRERRKKERESKIRKEDGTKGKGRTKGLSDRSRSSEENEEDDDSYLDSEEEKEKWQERERRRKLSDIIPRVSLTRVDLTTVDPEKSVYSEDPKIQKRMEKLEEMKRKKKGEQKGDMMERWKEVTISITEYMARDDVKITKQASGQVMRRVLDLQQIVVELMGENKELTARLDEKEKENERLWTEIRKGGRNRRDELEVAASEEEAMHWQEETTVEESRKKARKTYAVVVQGKGIKEPEELQKKLWGVTKDLDMNVERVRRIRDGKIILEMATEKDKKRILEERRIMESGMKAEEVKKYRPLMRIGGVEKEMKDEELLEEVWRRNFKEQLTEEDYKKTVKVKMRIGRRDGNVVSVILEVDPGMRDRLVEKGRVFIGWRVHRVEKFEQPMRCLKCYGFSHKAKDCKEKERCGNCGEEGHKRKDCQGEVGCAVCKGRKKEGGHSVWSEVCPEAKWRLERWRERTLE
uniref:CCHC-type domain-containing protein n=1 Tax=Trichogramma kaykai TaxID=54128 RepID=A0ABD2XSC9_9HYME